MEPIQWDQIFKADSYLVGLKKHASGVWFVVCAGTEDAKQWLLNVEAWMEHVDELGQVHSGFNEGLAALWPKIQAIIWNDPFILTGHSRGAAQATLLTGYALRAGKRPLARYVFGEPLSCDAAVARVIASVPSVSFCAVDRDDNYDPVVAVPVSIPGMFPYERVKPLTYLLSAPSKRNPWPMPIALHWAPDYQQALGHELARLAA